MLIAGIGSRRTPESSIEDIARICDFIKSTDGYVRSGHAPGADMFFEKAARDRTIVYLPWRGFNGLVITPHKVICSELAPNLMAAAEQSVIDFHPNHENLRSSGWKFMMRNYFQIWGSSQKRLPVDAVVCWAPEDKQGVMGGTGQAVRIALHNNIPVFNLNKTKVDDILYALALLEATNVNTK